ncbi:MAG: RHS repeat-associated core domain-containing protein [Chitinophagales bacterium]|nr:RHS repeat-associated core domain-containing protein [Chitinophagales bacterium]
MPGRSYSSTAYKYGFNGKEKDDEVSGTGNQYDYGFRIYNPRIGKFLSVDPLTKAYPWYTPYQFAGNKPIWAIDLDGLEEHIATVLYDDKQQVSKIRVATYLDKETHNPVDVDLKTSTGDVTNKQFAIYHIDASTGKQVKPAEYTDNPDNAIIIVQATDDNFTTSNREGKFEVTTLDGSKSNKILVANEVIKSADVRKLSVENPTEATTEASTEKMIQVESKIPGPKVYNVVNSTRKEDLEAGVSKSNPNGNTSLPISHTPSSTRERIDVGKLNPSTTP